MLIPRSVAIDLSLWKTVDASNMRMLPKVKHVYFLSTMPLLCYRCSITALEIVANKVPHRVHHPEGSRKKLKNHQWRYQLLLKEPHIGIPPASAIRRHLVTMVGQLCSNSC